MDVLLRILYVLLFVMMPCVTLDVEENLTAVVEGNITFPDPVTERGHINFGTNTIASVSGRQIEIKELSYINRLHWNTTGHFTLTRLQKNDSGVYTVKRGDVFTKRYNVTIHGCAVLSVLEGKTVTMTTGVVLVPDHYFIWSHGLQKEKEIVNCKKDYCKTDDGLKSHLSVDYERGDLSINNITKEFSGVFWIKLYKGVEEHITKCFKVIVYEYVSTPNISSLHSDEPWSCHINFSVLNQGDVNLTLFEGDTVISFSSSDQPILHLSLDVHSPSEDTYKCEAANPVSKRDMSVNITDYCPKPHTGLLWWHIALRIAAVAAGVILVVVVWKKTRSICSTNELRPIMLNNLPSNSVNLRDTAGNADSADTANTANTADSADSADSANGEEKNLLQNDGKLIYKSFEETQ